MTRNSTEYFSFIFTIQSFNQISVKSQDKQNIKRWKEKIKDGCDDVENVFIQKFLSNKK